MSKLILGTAQFSPNYGITNKIGSLKQKNVNDILNLYKKKNFKFIEISASYKNAIDKLVKTKNTKDLKYIFKINFTSLINKHSSKQISYIKKYQKKLKVKKFDYLLIQNFDKYYKEKNLFNEVQRLSKNLKLNGLINKFGISTYNFYDLKFLKKLKIDSIQLPFSIFDQRLIKKNYHKNLKKNKIKIFVRSIFLQGILLENLDNLKIKFYKYKKYFLRLENYCKKKKISKIDTCICFVKKFKEIEGIVVGALNSDQLNQTIKSSKKRILINFKPVKNKKLINVLLW